MCGYTACIYNIALFDIQHSVASSDTWLFCQVTLYWYSICAADKPQMTFNFRSRYNHSLTATSLYEAVGLWRWRAMNTNLSKDSECGADHIYNVATHSPQRMASTVYIEIFTRQKFTPNYFAIACHWRKKIKHTQQYLSSLSYQTAQLSIGIFLLVHTVVVIETVYGRLMYSWLQDKHFLKTRSLLIHRDQCQYQYTLTNLTSWSGRLTFEAISVSVFTKLIKHVNSHSK